MYEASRQGEAELTRNIRLRGDLTGGAEDTWKGEEGRTSHALMEDAENAASLDCHLKCTTPMMT